MSDLHGREKQEARSTRDRERGKETADRRHIDQAVSAGGPDERGGIAVSKEFSVSRNSWDFHKACGVHSRTGSLSIWTQSKIRGKLVGDSSDPCSVAYPGEGDAQDTWCDRHRIVDSRAVRVYGGISRWCRAKLTVRPWWLAAIGSSPSEEPQNSLMCCSQSNLRSIIWRRCSCSSHE